MLTSAACPRKIQTAPVKRIAMQPSVTPTSSARLLLFTRNSYTLQLDDEQGSMIPLSKQSEKELQALLGY